MWPAERTLSCCVICILSLRGLPRYHHQLSVETPWTLHRNPTLYPLNIQSNMHSDGQQFTADDELQFLFRPTISMRITSPLQFSVPVSLSRYSNLNRHIYVTAMHVVRVSNYLVLVMPEVTNIIEHTCYFLHQLNKAFTTYKLIVSLQNNLINRRAFVRADILVNDKSIPTRWLGTLKRAIYLISLRIPWWLTVPHWVDARKPITGVPITHNFVHMRSQISGGQSDMHHWCH